MCHPSGRDNNKVESYSAEKDKWTQLDEYPYHDELYLYATVATSQGAFIIGGYYSSEPVSTIASINSSKWTPIGDLLYARYGHSAIINGNNILVVGGQGTFSTEIWSMKENELYLHLTEPKLNNYYRYPELFLVDSDYCTRN